MCYTACNPHTAIVCSDLLGEYFRYADGDLVILQYTEEANKNINSNCI